MTTWCLTACPAATTPNLDRSGERSMIAAARFTAPSATVAPQLTSKAGRPVAPRLAAASSHQRQQQACCNRRSSRVQSSSDSPAAAAETAALDPDDLDAAAADGDGSAAESAASPAEGAASASAAPAPKPAAHGSIEQEILAIALPTLATLAADPLASLVSTGFVGRLGATPLASVGVALSLYNSATKLLNMPLLAVTTSSVAQALGAGQQSEDGHNEALESAVSAAVVLALCTGLAQAVLLAAFGGQGLSAWGASPEGPLFADASAFLAVRALTAPVTVLMLVLQGCFRGLGDTRVPFVATLLANLLNIALEPILIFWCGWGVRGAATAVGLSQAAACGVLLWMLQRRCRLRVVGGEALGRSLSYLKSTGLLACRTLAVMGVYSLATSLAARTDPAHAAAHQIAFQVWLASSLLADSLAVAAQTLLARSIAAGESATGRTVVNTTLQMALALGCTLAAGLTLGKGQVAGLFSADPEVLACLAAIMPAVVATQPLNSLAFLMDGILYGVGGFSYAATAMLAAALPAGATMLIGASLAGRLVPPAAFDSQLSAVWAGLAVLMAGRFLTLFVPMLRRSPPFDQIKG